MKKLWKQRKAKSSTRGVYIQDKELSNTEFNIGKKISYFIDVNQKKLIILPTEEEANNKNTVAQRKLKDRTKAVIDLRKKEVVDLFKDCDYLQVSIYNDEITVEGFVEKDRNETEQGFVSKTINKVKNILTSKRDAEEKKVFYIDKFLHLKKTQEMVLSKKEFLKVAGAEQLSFDFNWDINIQSQSVTSNNSSFNLKKALKNLFIPLTLGSWFAGAGILDEAFKQEGYNVEYAIEKDENAAMTYRYNHDDNIIVKNVLDVDKSSLPKPAIMIAGVPCTSYTKINPHKKFIDHPDFFLFKEYIEGIKNNENCQVWMIENVEEFVKVYDGYCIKEIQQQLPDFEITYGILNSADYGSAMVRKRAIVIGSKIGKINLPEPTVEKSEYRPISSVLQGITDDLPNQRDYNKHKPETLERIKHIPQGGNHKDLPEELRKGLRAQFSDYLKRLHWNNPSISIPHPRKNLILHPFEDRVLSVREIARIFGLTDDFVFLGKTLDSRQQQIANSVPIRLGRAVAEVIKHAVMQFNIRNRNIATL